MQNLNEYTDPARSIRDGAIDTVVIGAVIAIGVNIFSGSDFLKLNAFGSLFVGFLTIFLVYTLS